MIPEIPLITTKVRQLDERLWFLHRRYAEGIATPSELRELEARCNVMEAEQDNEEMRDGR